MMDLLFALQRKIKIFHIFEQKLVFILYTHFIQKQKRFWGKHIF